jgi:hypothetical protein
MWMRPSQPANQPASISALEVPACHTLFALLLLHQALKGSLAPPAESNRPSNVEKKRVRIAVDHVDDEDDLEVDRYNPCGLQGGASSSNPVLGLKRPGPTASATRLPRRLQDTGIGAEVGRGCMSGGSGGPGMASGALAGACGAGLNGFSIQLQGLHKGGGCTWLMVVGAGGVGGWRRVIAETVGMGWWS